LPKVKPKKRVTAKIRQATAKKRQAHDPPPADDRRRVLRVLRDLDAAAPTYTGRAEPSYNLEAVTDLMRSLRRGELVLLSRATLRRVIANLKGK
jgi:hypothetical protein